MSSRIIKDFLYGERMTVIFGKRSGKPSACGCCGCMAHNYGITTKKFSKLSDIMWICEECFEIKKWDRVYSMNKMKLNEIEDISIRIAISKNIRSFITLFLESIYSKNIFDIRQLDNISFDDLCESIRKDEILSDIIKDIFLEYSNQLKLWNI